MGKLQRTGDYIINNPFAFFLIALSLLLIPLYVHLFYVMDIYAQNKDADIVSSTEVISLDFLPETGSISTCEGVFELFADDLNDWLVSGTAIAEIQDNDLYVQFSSQQTADFDLTYAKNVSGNFALTTRMKKSDPNTGSTLAAGLAINSTNGINIKVELIDENGSKVIRSSYYDPAQNILTSQDNEISNHEFVELQILRQQDRIIISHRLTRDAIHTPIVEFSDVTATEFSARIINSLEGGEDALVIYDQFVVSCI